MSRQQALRLPEGEGHQEEGWGVIRLLYSAGRGPRRQGHGGGEEEALHRPASLRTDVLA